MTSTDERQKQHSGGGLPPDAPKGAWVEIKTINGHQYRYLRWREGEHRRSKYLGKASSEES